MKLTPAQEAMIETLKELGPLDSVGMMIYCGRQWRRVWEALEEHHPTLIRYAPYAKNDRCYRAA